METLRNVKRITKVTGALLGAGLVAFGTVFGAATFPDTFVDGNNHDVLVVVGANAAATDTLGAIDVVTALQSTKICKTEETEAIIEGDVTGISESSDLLELYENMGDVRETLTESNLEGLEGGEISTGKGKTDYKQYLRFEESGGEISAGTVVYEENEDDKVGDYLKFEDGTVMFEYELEFSEGLESDIDNDQLEDLEDEELVILGQPFTIVNAEIDTTNEELELLFLGGADSLIMDEGEEKNITIGDKDYNIKVLLISDEKDSEDMKVKFNINGEDVDKMSEGDTEELSDGTIIGVRELLDNEFGEGKDLVEFFIGANKVEFKDNYGDDDFESGVEINSENIEDASVKIKGFVSGDDFKITTIKYRLNADAEDGGNIYVPEGKGVRSFLDEPEGMLGNWDIIYEGLEDHDFSEIELDSSGDDEYKLKFENRNGLEYNVPFLSTEGDFKYGDEDDDLIFREDTSTTRYFIDEDDYFVVTDDNDETGVTHILRYESIDDDSNKLQLNDEGAGSLEFSYEGTEGVDAEGEIIVGGNTYQFYVGDGPDYSLAVDLTNDGKVDGSEAFIVVKGGGLLDLDEISGTTATFTLRTLASEFDEPSADEEIVFNVEDSGSELDVDLVSGVNTFNHDNNNDIESGMTRYGVYVEIDDDNSNDADNLQIEYPLQQRGAEVSVAMGETTITDTKEVCVPYDGKITPVLDTEVTDPSASNLILVGGPAVNRLTAQFLGLEYPTYGNEIDGFEPGDYFAKLVENGDNVAMLVYGYTAADTRTIAVSLGLGESTPEKYLQGAN